MDISRRSLLQGAIAGGVAGVAVTEKGLTMQPTAAPLQLISTWKFGQAVNDRALATYERTQSLLDAIEQGIWVAEEDVENSSVGRGGIPNAAGVVQLDASIMWGPAHQAGAVAALEGILYPISVARRVMEKTPHVMLVGEGARQFALEEGFETVELLTPQRRRDWEEWKKKHTTKSDSSHDTITVLGVSSQGDLCGGCSTSGWGYKLPGRVGDSPILGSGLYVDNDIGAAGSTGLGEIMMRHCAAFMVVERMRSGDSPQQACVEAVKRILKKERSRQQNSSINLIALDRRGRWGAAGTDANFCAAVASPGDSRIMAAEILTI